MTQSLDRVGSSRVEKVLDDAVVDDRESGVVRANRRIFTDEEIFELEMAHIFEGSTTASSSAGWSATPTAGPSSSVPIS